MQLSDSDKIEIYANTFFWKFVQNCILVCCVVFLQRYLGNVYSCTAHFLICYCKYNWLHNYSRQVVNQILSRVTKKHNIFNKVVLSNHPGMNGGFTSYWPFLPWSNATFEHHNFHTIPIAVWSIYNKQTVVGMLLRLMLSTQCAILIGNSNSIM